MDDIPALVQACNDPDIAEMTSVPHPYTEADARAFVTGLRATLEAEGLHVYLAHTADGELVGSVDLHGRRGPSAELGYWTAAAHRGRGYAQEACEAVLDEGFSHLGLEVVRIRVRTDNPAALAVARRLGFSMHAVIPSEVLGRGILHDAWVGTLIAADWAQRGAPHTVRPDESSTAAMVRQFHALFNMTIGSGEANLDHPQVAMRLRLIAEEFIELVAAVRGPDAARVIDTAFATIDQGPIHGDVVATADALGDLTYVIYGMAILTGIPLDSVLREIHRSNLTKLDNDGRPILRADGKVLKGPHYEPPRLREILTGRTES